MDREGVEGMEGLDGVILWLEKDELEMRNDSPLPELPSKENTRIDKILSSLLPPSPLSPSLISSFLYSSSLLSSHSLILFRNCFIECLYSFIKKVDPFIQSSHLSISHSQFDLQSAFDFQAYLNYTNSLKPTHFLFNFVKTQLFAYFLQ
jgi:hypothetical protein